MATKMIRVSESDAEWLTAFAGELQTARASRVSIAEAISTLIVEHREAERETVAAAALGKSTGGAKAEAARRNGAKGGRPRKARDEAHKGREETDND